MDRVAPGSGGDMLFLPSGQEFLISQALSLIPPCPPTSVSPLAGIRGSQLRSGSSPSLLRPFVLCPPYSSHGLEHPREFLSPLLDPSLHPNIPRVQPVKSHPGKLGCQLENDDMNKRGPLRRMLRRAFP